MSTTRLLQWLGGLVFTASLGHIAGCAASSGPIVNTAYMIGSPKAEFYKYGPAQSFGPDLSLDRGQRLTLLQKQYGFSHVMLPDGTDGYVPTEDLKPAPTPPPTPKPVLAKVFGSSRHVASGRAPSVVPPLPEPGLDVNDVPVPLPKEPEPTPKPQFRY